MKKHTVPWYQCWCRKEYVDLEAERQDKIDEIWFEYKPKLEELKKEFTKGHKFTYSD